MEYQDLPPVDLLSAKHFPLCLRYVAAPPPSDDLLVSLPVLGTQSDQRAAIALSLLGL